MQIGHVLTRIDESQMSVKPGHQIASLLSTHSLKKWQSAIDQRYLHSQSIKFMVLLCYAVDSLTVFIDIPMQA